MALLLASLQYLPLVLQAVVAVEQAAANADGKSKKQIAMSSIDAVAKAGESAPQKDVSLVSTLVDTVVASLNSAGVFQHAANTTPAPTK